MNFLIRDLDKQVHASLKEEAERKGVSMNDLFKLILEDYTKSSDSNYRTIPEIYLERQEVFYYAIERNNNILDFLKEIMKEEASA